MQRRSVSSLCAALAAANLAAFPAYAQTTLAEVLVQAETEALDTRRHAPATRIVYGRDDIERYTDLTVGQVLIRLPGVTFTGPPGQIKDVSLRGLEKGYTQILIDGQPVPGGEKERNLQVDRIPAALIERIEIIRNSTPEMGDEGIGGIINIVMRAAAPKRISGFTAGLGQLDGKTGGQFSGYLGDKINTGVGTVSWLMAGSFSERPDIKTKTKDMQEFHATAAPVAPGTGVTRRTKWEKETEDERVDARELSLTPRLNWQINDLHSLVLSPHLIKSEETKTKTKAKQAFALSNTTGLPTGAITNTREIESEDKDRTLSRLRGDWKMKLAGRGELSAFASVQSGDEEKSKTKLEYNATNVLTKTTNESEQKDDSNNALGVKALLSLGANHLVTLGLDGGQKERTNGKTTFEINNLTNVTTIKLPGLGDRFDITETRINLWAQDEWQIAPTFSLTPGVRFKQQKTRSVDGLGIAKEGTIRATSPSLHSLWQVHPSLNLRASVAQSLRAPKFDDLSSITETASGANSATNPDKSGNPALQPEKALGTEISLEYFLPAKAGVVGLNVFNRDVENLVQKEARLEGARFVERPYNVGDARIWGAELDIKTRMDVIGLKDLTLRANYAWLNSKVAATGQRMKEQPEYVYNLGFDYVLPWGLTMGATYNHKPAFVKENTALKYEAESAQKLLDVYVAKKIGKNLNLRLTAGNALDASKEKDKREFHANGNRKKLEQELEQGAPRVFLALEGVW